MKKILYTTIFAASFAFAGQAQAALYEQQSAYEYESSRLVDGGGGGGGGTTTVYQPTTSTNSNDTLMLNPNTNLNRDEIHQVTDSQTAVNSGLTQQATTTLATVSSCPSGTTMSSDKCCCVNN